MGANIFRNFPTIAAGTAPGVTTTINGADLEPLKTFILNGGFEGVVTVEGDPTGGGQFSTIATFRAGAAPANPTLPAEQPQPQISEVPATDLRLRIGLGTKVLTDITVSVGAEENCACSGGGAGGLTDINGQAGPSITFTGDFTLTGPNTFDFDSGITTINGETGPAITFVSPMLTQPAANTIRLDNGNSKDLPDPFVQADIDTEVNTAFVVPKLTGALVMPIPAVPTNNPEDRKITFKFTSNGVNTPEWPGGAGGYRFADSTSPTGITKDQHDATFANANNDDIVKVAWARDQDNAVWLCVGLTGNYII